MDGDFILLIKILQKIHRNEKIYKANYSNKSLEPSNMIMATLPANSGTTVDGQTVLGKGGSVWDLDEEENY